MTALPAGRLASLSRSIQAKRQGPHFRAGPVLKIDRALRPGRSQPVKGDAWLRISNPSRGTNPLILSRTGATPPDALWASHRAGHAESLPSPPALARSLSVSGTGGPGLGRVLKTHKLTSYPGRFPTSWGAIITYGRI